MHEVYVWCYAGGQDVETDCAIVAYSDAAAGDNSSNHVECSPLNRADVGQSCRGRHEVELPTITRDVALVTV